MIVASLENFMNHENVDSRRRGDRDEQVPTAQLAGSNPVG